MMIIDRYKPAAMQTNLAGRLAIDELIDPHKKRTFPSSTNYSISLEKIINAFFDVIIVLLQYYVYSHYQSEPAMGTPEWDKYNAYT